MSLKNRDRTEATVGRILVVDDHQHARESIAFALRNTGYQADCVASGVEAIRAIGGESYDVVVTDLQMPGMSGLELVVQLERRRYGAQVVMVTAHATVSTAVEAMRHGAFDYLEKPFDVEKLEQTVARALERGRLLDSAAEITHGDALAMVGDSAVMRGLRARIVQVASTAETVLVVGESGTGKEVVARMIHAHSPRNDKPLISLNCPALSAHLMESELFGHERGAFTGADAPRTGRFELADSGTILLDEVTEIDLPLQAKLLRVLQERAFERVGSSKTLNIDARVIATSNKNLRQEVTAGRFREDLYYRLAVVPLIVPPLRDRRDDIPALVRHFLDRAATRLKREPCSIATDAFELLVNYRWPGNVRELENIVTRASVLNVGSPISSEELRDWLTDAPHNESAENVPLGLTVEEMERRLIEATLAKYHGHRAKTAEALGIGLRTLSGKLKAYGYAPREKPILIAT